LRYGCGRSEKELCHRFAGRIRLNSRRDRKEAHINRLLLFAAIFLSGLSLLCGSLFAGNPPLQRSRLPIVDNPYCDIATYLLPDFPEQATSLNDGNGRPVVVINATTLAKDPAYGQFLMAHECCHHTLGHVQRYYEGLGHLGPQPFYYIRPQLKQMELDADSCAVKLLKNAHNEAAIEAARQIMSGFGEDPTGAYYPTGIERAGNIACAAAEN
jgi:hypothetical protein